MADRPENPKKRRAKLLRYIKKSAWQESQAPASVVERN